MVVDSDARIAPLGSVGGGGCRVLDMLSDLANPITIEVWLGAFYMYLAGGVDGV